MVLSKQHGFTWQSIKEFLIIGIIITGSSKNQFREEIGNSLPLNYNLFFQFLSVIQVSLGEIVYSHDVSKSVNFTLAPS